MPLVIPKHDYFQDNYSSMFIGEVINNSDPDNIGKIKVRVIGMFDDLEEGDIPWAYPATGFTAGSASGSGFYSVPKVGSTVAISFDQGNIYHPEYYFIQKISDELKDKVSESPTGFHSILYDTDENVKAYYSQSEGMYISYKDSKFNIRPDNTVYIEHAGGRVVHVQNDMISLGKENVSDEPAVLGQTLYDTMMQFITDLGNISAITTPSGPSGTISTSPVWIGFVNKWKAEWKKILSKKVSLD